MEAFQEHISQIKRVWEDYVINGTTPKDIGKLIRRDVLESWKRSKAKRLDPYNIKKIYIPENHLEEKVNVNIDLIMATQPVFTSFSELLSDDMAFKIDIYDRELIYLKGLYSHHDQEKEKKRWYVEPGLRREESISGTTAMSLVHATGKPFQLRGPEHYDVKLHGNVCTSVPIYAPDGTLTGIINLAETYTAETKRTLPIMIAFGKSVEYNLLQMSNKKHLEAANNLNVSILETINQAIIVVNEQDVIERVNRSALNMLGLDNHDIVGHTSSEVFGPDNVFHQAQEQAKLFSHKEVSLKVKGTIKYFVGTVLPFSSNDGKISGVVGVLNDMVSAKNMLKNFAGWTASFTFDQMIGDSPIFRQTIELAKGTAIVASNTLIQGESGTGKEMFAQAIHNAGPFRDGPFVTINCAAIPITLMESELFGYEGGAYTGGKKGGQAGKFEMAEGGTIFLDEINSLPMDMQAKLLRVLQTKMITRVGGTENILLNVKIVAASNVYLSDLVEKGLFRADLFYRINIITINLPPLRERADDIPALVSHSLNRISASLKSRISITKEAVSLLQKYSWPGNIRELENLLERTTMQMIVKGRSQIDKDALNAFFQGLPREGGFENRGRRSLPKNLQQGIESLEERTIRELLAKNRWNISKTAKALGIARNTLYRKIAYYNILDA